ncbi:MAG: HEAT repeat domain-containing protein [Acidobacteriota bacterium]
MTREEFSEKFSPLPPQEKIKFLYTNIDSLGREDRIALLLGLLREEDSSPLVKATALKFLRESPYQDLEVYKKYLQDNFRAIANAAKRAVKEFEEKGKQNSYYAEAVLRKLNSLPDKERRLKILKAISRLKASWVLRVLLEALADPCESNRDFLVRELSQREVWSPAPFYEKLARPPWFAKSAVLKILGGRKDSGAVPAIAEAVTDANIDVRRSAADALGEIGGKEALALLVRLAKDPSRYVRQAAGEALRKVSRVRFSG